MIIDCLNKSSNYQCSLGFITYLKAKSIRKYITKMEVYYCKVPILYVKWHNITSRYTVMS